MKLLPDQLLGGIGMPDLDEEQTKTMEKELRRTESIIDSMTKEERYDHKILNANRRRRIARGSGTTVAEVNALIKQYTEMRQMMRQLSTSGMFGGSGLKGKLMRRMAGMSGMPGLEGMGGNGDDGDIPSLPAGPSRKKKKRWKKKR
jgi:signal recognition particle subunit SRP54